MDFRDPTALSDRLAGTFTSPQRRGGIGDTSDTSDHGSVGDSNVVVNLTHRIRMYAIDGNIYHQYTPNVRLYTIHGSYG